MEATENQWGNQGHSQKQKHPSQFENSSFFQLALMKTSTDRDKKRSEMEEILTIN